MINNRMCVACRTKKHKDELTRISVLNGNAVVDNKKQQTSRAIYVCKNQNCIQKLEKSRAIKRLLKAESGDEFYKNLLK